MNTNALARNAKLRSFCFESVKEATAAIGEYRGIDYVAKIGGEKSSGYAYGMIEFKTQLNRAGFVPGRDSITVWLPR